MSECSNENISEVIAQENGAGDAKNPDNKETKLNMELKNRLRKYIKKLDGNVLKKCLIYLLPFRIGV